MSDVTHNNEQEYLPEELPSDHVAEKLTAEEAYQLKRAFRDGGLVHYSGYE